MTSIQQFNNNEFRPNTFVIDPAGCGCTDCLLGYSTPANELRMDQITTAIGLGFELVDRRNQHEKTDGMQEFPLNRPVDPEWVRVIMAMKKS